MFNCLDVGKRQGANSTADVNVCSHEKLFWCDSSQLRKNTAIMLLKIYNCMLFFVLDKKIALCYNEPTAIVVDHFRIEFGGMLINYKKMDHVHRKREKFCI